jgi:3-deoxy-D-manno-octulosonic-acid transferase
MGVILAASEDDAAVLRTVVPEHAALSVGGDPGMETVLRRLDEAPLPPYPAASAASPVLVAGSTWPPDEALLGRALQGVLAQLPALRLVIAPHEPTEEHLAALEAQWAGRRVVRLSAWEQAPGAEPPQVLLVDRVGRLAGLYRLGTLAYVGGAFTTGVHNVAEPAAAGLPVLFGPRYHNSPAAAALLEAETAQTVLDAAALEAALVHWLKSPDRCVTVGRHARARIDTMASAAPRCWEALTARIPALAGPGARSG